MIKRIVTTALLAGAAAMAAAGPAVAAEHPVLDGNGEGMHQDQSLSSEDGSVEFKSQEDAKIAIYWDGESRWQNTKEQRYDVKG